MHEGDAGLFLLGSGQMVLAALVAGSAFAFKNARAAGWPLGAIGGLLGGLALGSEMVGFWFLAGAGSSFWEGGGLAVLLMSVAAAGLVGGLVGAVVSARFARKPGDARLVTLLVDAAALALPSIILMRGG